MARTISHSFASLTREILFLPLEHVIHIFSPPCNILYIYLATAIFWSLFTLNSKSKRSFTDICSLRQIGFNDQSRRNWGCKTPFPRCYNHNSLIPVMPDHRLEKRQKESRVLVLAIDWAHATSYSPYCAMLFKLSSR